MIGQHRYEFRSVGSTNDLAKTGVLHGVEEGTVYIANHQTAGRGRRGTTWNDQEGESVLMTVVLYPNLPIGKAWQIGWAACTSIVEALKQFHVKAHCKWPNDVVVDGKKIAGVLVETVSRPGMGFAALVGMGVNVAQREFGIDSDFRVPPTSMRIVLGDLTPSVAAVECKICSSFNSVYRTPNLEWNNLYGTYRRLLLLGELQLGLDVDSGKHLTGRLVDVRESDGAALLESQDGKSSYVLPSNRIVV